MKKFNDFVNENVNYNFTNAVRSKRSFLYLELYDSPITMKIQIPRWVPDDIEINMPSVLDLEDFVKLDGKSEKFFIKELVKPSKIGSEKIARLIDEFEKNVADVVDDTKKEIEDKWKEWKK